MSRVQAMLAIAAALLAGVACDPVLASKIDALGGNAPGVRNGPLHRPGQPCTLCHDGAFRDPPAFSVAGTVYTSADSAVPLAGAIVTLVGADGASFPVMTNDAGNFYVSPDAFSPKYPMRVSVAYGGTTVQMQSHVGWSGSCGTCHADPAGPDSPGHVYFNVVGKVP